MKDADVILEVAGRSEEIETRHAQIGRAVLRGGTEREAIQLALGLLLAFAAGVAAASFVVSGGFLVGLDTTATAVTAITVGFLGFFLGVYWGTWAYPSIEVAPIGQTNFRRIIRILGPVLLTVLLAGVTKKLFG